MYRIHIFSSVPVLAFWVIIITITMQYSVVIFQLHSLGSYRFLPSDILERNINASVQYKYSGKADNNMCTASLLHLL
jgi:hypothetical protein